MQINWGIKIAFLYLGFVMLILIMVTMAMQQKIDLVSDDYYDQELHYQEKIDNQKRAVSLQEKLTWEMSNGKLLVKFPSLFRLQPVAGTIHFFRPSDSKLDKNVSMPADTSLIRTIEIKDLRKGVYKIQIDWQVNDAAYYNEGFIQIN
jgi:hypothetical protein